MRDPPPSSIPETKPMENLRKLQMLSASHRRLHDFYWHLLHHAGSRKRKRGQHTVEKPTTRQTRPRGRSQAVPLGARSSALGQEARWGLGSRVLDPPSIFILTWGLVRTQHLGLQPRLNQNLRFNQTPRWPAGLRFERVTGL